MNSVFRIGLHGKGTSEQKLKEARECVWLIPGKSILDRSNSQCKGLGAGAHSVAEGRQRGEWLEWNENTGQLWEMSSECMAGRGGGPRERGR